jgi:hypothetical protein
VKVIIAGSRSVKRLEDVAQAVKESGFTITTVISGTAAGADRLGEEWARDKGIPVERFPADWEKHGKKAGFIRNVQMAETAAALIAIWDGKAKGTAHMIGIAERRCMRVFKHIVP